MANHVEFQDFSFEVKAELNNTSIGWALDTGNEIVSQIQRTVSTSGWTNAERTQLRDSYKCRPGNTDGEVHIGTPLEQGYWEEWGTGEHAAHGDGRKGWWIYTPDDEGPPGYKSNTYYDEMEAMMMAAHIQAKYNKKAYVTNGRKPNYTMENAFKAVKNPAIERLERLMKERMGT